jgi:hypothetical protein
MRVLLSTIGSRGDVQPLVALALQLTALGQEVCLCAPPDFREWIDTLGIGFAPIGPEVRGTAKSTPWQRCTVHFLRDLRGHARKDQHDALGALIRQLFTALDANEAHRRLGDAVAQLHARLPKIAALLEDAEDDVLAF